MASKDEASVADKQETDEAAPLAPSTPPDGGFEAWTMVAGSFFLNFCIWGYFNAFGAFEAYYLSALPQHSPSSIAWIGTIQAWLFCVGGTLSGPLFDLGHFRYMLVAGCTILVFGAMMLSLSAKYWQIFLTQGVVMGVGSALLYTPAVALVAATFRRRRGFAVSLGVAGSNVGGVIYPLVFRRLQPRIGFPWAARVMAFISLAAFLISIAIMIRKKPQTSGKARDLFERKALTDPPYLIFALSLFFSLLAYFLPFEYITAYAQYVVGTDTNLSFYLVAIVNAGNFAGRLVAGFVADRIGPFQALAINMCITGILILCWIAVKSTAATIVWAVLFGFFSGGISVLPAAVFPIICPDPRVLGTRIGMGYSIGGTGILLGGPIGGALTTSTLGHFAHAQGAAGAFMLLALLCEVGVGIYVLRFRGRRTAEIKRPAMAM